MDEVDKIEECFIELIDKMKLQVFEPKNQSFGSLKYHMDIAVKIVDTKGFMNPLYFVNLPRWMGEYGNTDLEEEINAIAIEIDNLVIQLHGGREKVNKLRDEHNKNLGF